MAELKALAQAITTGDQIKAVEFTKAYYKMYGKDAPPPSYWSGYCFDAVGILAAAAQRASERGELTRKSLRDTLAAFKKYKGVTGDISFEGSGTPLPRKASLVVWRKGEFVEW